MIGRRLAHYHILEKLGEGGMGEVWRARDEKLGRDVAIKILPAELTEDAGRRSRFEREAQAVAALNHPNVVTIHAVEEADGIFFLVMELVEGVTLSRKIPGGGLALRDFFRLALPLADAVAAAHARGITHRDLKPENVMVDDTGRLKVLDFGLAKLLDDQVEHDRTVAVQTREGVILGTAAYMSPEQAEGRPVDPRSDVFTLGILLYEMLCGQRPFSGDTPMSTLTSVIRDDPVPVIQLRPELPREFQRIVRRCLEKDPDRRYESAKGIRYDLEVLREEILSGEYDPAAPVATVGSGSRGPGSLDPMLSRSQPPATPKPAGPFTRRRMLFGAVVILIVAAGAWLWPRGGGEGTPERRSLPAASENPLVVVFPFENLGPPEDEYFAAGIADEITTRLAGVEGIRVLSRSSASQYDREGKSLARIREDLGVDYVLEGAVRWQRPETGPSRVRVSPELVAVENGVQVWAEAFDRTMDEIFVVQAEIAEAVARSLGGALGGGTGSGDLRPERPTESLDAYHFYLRASNALAGLGTLERSEMEICVSLLENAVRIDPEFAEAWGLLARAHASIIHFGWDQSPERLAESRLAMDRALVLDPENAVVQLGAGYYYYHGLKQYEKALEAFSHAARIQPGNAEIMVATGYVLRRQGRVPEALERFWKALELSPNDVSMLFDVSETLMLLRRYEEAMAYSMQAVRQAPDNSRMYYVSAWAHAVAGDLQTAQDILAAYPGVPGPEIDATRLVVAYVSRDFPTALEQVEGFPDLYRNQFQVRARELARARILKAMGVEARVEQAAKLAETALRQDLAQNPDDSNITAAVALARAFQGTEQAEAAVADARRSLELFPASQDTWIRTFRQKDLIDVLILADRHDEAVAEIADLLGQHTGVISIGLLKHSPDFDPLRQHPGFLALLDR